MLRTTNKNKFIVVDNFIPFSYQEKLKEWIYNGSFPWYYVGNVTTTENKEFRPAMSHLIYDNGEKISTLEIDILAHVGAEKFNWVFNSITIAKTILQFPLNENCIGKNLDTLHVDVDPFYPHLVVLYYVFDADGDTLITDLQYDGSLPTTIPYENQNIMARVTPKQGRAVIFDGRFYHTAEQPKKGMRGIINLNLQ